MGPAGGPVTGSRAGVRKMWVAALGPRKFRCSRRVACGVGATLEGWLRVTAGIPTAYTYVSKTY